jgi:signal peptidase I
MDTKKILGVIGNVLMWTIFAFALLTVILTFTEEDGIPNLFGYGYLSVQSDSMEPEFAEGDLIFVKSTDAEDNFQEDDVVTFRTVIEGQQVLNTHRIISFTEVGGTRYYTTQGDNVEQSDPNTITSGDIVAEYVGLNISGLGNASDYLQTRTGFLILIVLPLAALFMYQLANFAIIIANYKVEQNKVIDKLKDPNNLTAEQKAEIARQYLETLDAQKAEAEVTSEKESKTSTAKKQPAKSTTAKKTTTTKKTSTAKKAAPKKTSTSTAKKQTKETKKDDNKKTNKKDGDKS